MTKNRPEPRFPLGRKPARPSSWMATRRERGTTDTLGTPSAGMKVWLSQPHLETLGRRPSLMRRVGRGMERNSADKGPSPIVAPIEANGGLMRDERRSHDTNTWASRGRLACRRCHDGNTCSWRRTADGIPAGLVDVQSRSFLSVVSVLPSSSTSLRSAFLKASRNESSLTRIVLS